MMQIFWCYKANRQPGRYPIISSGESCEIVSCIFLSSEPFTNLVYVNITYLQEIYTVWYNSTPSETQKAQVEYHTWTGHFDNDTNTLGNEPSPLPSLMSTCPIWLYIIDHAMIIESRACQSSGCIIPPWLIGIIFPPGPSLSDHASSCRRTWRPSIDSWYSRKQEELIYWSEDVAYWFVRLSRLDETSKRPYSTRYPSEFQIHIADLDKSLLNCQDTRCLSYYIAYACQVDAVELHMTGLDCFDLRFVQTRSQAASSKFILHYLGRNELIEPAGLPLPLP